MALVGQPIANGCLQAVDTCCLLGLQVRGDLRRKLVKPQDFKKQGSKEQQLNLQHMLKQMRREKGQVEAGA